jgi:hypothetical protein
MTFTQTWRQKSWVVRNGSRIFLERIARATIRRPGHRPSSQKNCLLHRLNNTQRISITMNRGLCYLASQLFRLLHRGVLHGLRPLAI